MPIILGPEHEQLIAEALSSGVYQSSEEVVKSALELLRERDTWRSENRAKIEEGYAAAQRGELLDEDEVAARMEQKKRAWLSDQRKG
jgi:antitoxin ParD1/3/4